MRCGLAAIEKYLAVSDGLVQEVGIYVCMSTGTVLVDLLTGRRCLPELRLMGAEGMRWGLCWCACLRHLRINEIVSWRITREARGDYDGIMRALDDWQGGAADFAGLALFCGGCGLRCCAEGALRAWEKLTSDRLRSALWKPGPAYAGGLTRFQDI